MSLMYFPINHKEVLHYRSCNPDPKYNQYNCMKSYIQKWFKQWSNCSLLHQKIDTLTWNDLADLPVCKTAEDLDRKYN